MRFLLVCLLAYFATTNAVPTPQSGSISSTHASTLPKLAHRRDQAGKHSVQILYGQQPAVKKPDGKEQAGAYLWKVYHGPYGMAVNPCDATQFQWSGDYSAIIDKNDINNPPFPPQGQWNGALPLFAGDDNCIIRGMADGPPTLMCGPPSGEKGYENIPSRNRLTFIADFQKDVQYDDSVIVCTTEDEKETRYHRTWTVEYA
ncbi:hypothetical protein HBI23_252350 [Parastagonospora nodorum]|nr:hypothetical protein HBI23_252350 [Parastagonospora nodorum]KAH5622321.1 hypothetical protein HBI51_247520 [Parastagonospora nodorum]KAH5983413.1 hypothetical protein HBI84_247010 [Parastagonospora nodorum]KAH6134152.1 hypothetical protein HBI68_251440 [Parastagonospora nodorum]KAH6380494.1 hypothetical protein HBI08_237240 [Parastagonospora nodorum]